METLTGSSNSVVELPLRLAIAGRPRSFLVHVNALKDDSGSHMGISYNFV